MSLSKLEIYSIGIAAENLKLVGEDGKPNRILEVTPIEPMSMLDGEIKSGMEEGKVKSTDVNGGQYEIKTQTANSVKAIWLPMGSSNRFTAPNVRRNERLVLYRFADADVFYWTTLFDDIQLRKLETVIYAWSGTPVENDGDVTPENYYFLEVSTHKGLVHFHTSKKNGEFCSYDFQINTKDGLIRVQDDVGNFFIFDSKERQIAMTNADNCYLEINKKNMTLNVPETYTLRAKNVVEEVGEKITTKAGTSISEKTGSHSLDASGAVTEKSGSHTLNATGLVNLKAGGPASLRGAGVLLGGPVSIKAGP